MQSRDLPPARFLVAAAQATAATVTVVGGRRFYRGAAAKGQIGDFYR